MPQHPVAVVVGGDGDYFPRGNWRQKYRDAVVYFIRLVLSLILYLKTFIWFNVKTRKQPLAPQQFIALTNFDSNTFVVNNSQLIFSPDLPK